MYKRKAGTKISRCRSTRSVAFQENLPIDTEYPRSWHGWLHRSLEHINTGLRVITGTMPALRPMLVWRILEYCHSFQMQHVPCSCEICVTQARSLGTVRPGTCVTRCNQLYNCV